MTFFFFVVGLEARREFDLGELRERRRFALPMVAAISGMAVAVLIYLAFNAGRSSAHGWGIAMSTDTAFALGLLALVGPRFPQRLRAYLLTIAVVDDVVALVVIATVYTEEVTVSALLVAAGLFGAVLVAAGGRRAVRPRLRGAGGGDLGGAARVGRGARRRRPRDGPADLRLHRLRARTSSAPRSGSASSASSRRPSWRGPRARAQGGDLAERAAAAALPPVDELRDRAAVRARERGDRDRRRLPRAGRSPRRSRSGSWSATSSASRSGIVGASWLYARLSRGRLRPPVGWAAVAGGGTIAGVGFTVALLVATLAFDGPQLEEAKVGILGAALGASRPHLAAVPRHGAAAAAAHAPAPCSGPPSRSSTSTSTSTRSATTSAGRSTRRSRSSSTATSSAPTAARRSRSSASCCATSATSRYVWRHLPLNDVHPQAQLAAEAAEAAAEQGAFWPMHDLLLDHQDALSRARPASATPSSSASTSTASGTTCARTAGAARVAEDVDSADLSGVSGTPTFFINGRRHYGAYDIDTLSAAVRAAGARATLRGRWPRGSPEGRAAGAGYIDSPPSTGSTTPVM